MMVCHLLERLQILTFPPTDNMFHFTCFNVEDPHDPSVGLMNGQLSIPGNLLRREVFDPVVNEVCSVFNFWLPRLKIFSCRWCNSLKNNFPGLINLSMLSSLWEVLPAASILSNV